MEQWDADEPIHVSYEMRTEGWNRLRDSLYHAEDEDDHFAALWIMHRAGMVRGIRSHARTERQREKCLAGLAALSLGEVDLGRTLLASVAMNGRAGAWERMTSAYTLGAYAAKEQDADSALGWCVRYQQVLDRSAVSSDEEYAVEASRLHRCWAMVPMIRGETRHMIAEMDEAQEWASRMGDGPVATVTRCALFESRAKEHLQLGSLADAEDFATRYVRLAPTFSMSYMCLGKVHWEMERYDLALRDYRNAARYGPPMTEAAWYYMASCLEQTGAKAEAVVDVHLAALDVDPLGIAPLHGIIQNTLPGSVLRDWAETQLEARSAA